MSQVTGIDGSFTMGLGDGTKAGQGADINIILSRGQDNLSVYDSLTSKNDPGKQITYDSFANYSNNINVNSQVKLGNASRNDNIGKMETSAKPLYGSEKIIDPVTKRPYIDVLKDLFKEKAQVIPPIDCEGHWGNCDYSTGFQTYSVTREAQYFGKSCPNQTGDIQPCSVNFFQSIRKYIASGLTTSNLFGLAFIIVLIAVIISLFVFLRSVYDPKLSV